MSVTPEQVEDLMKLSGQVGSAPAPTPPPDPNDPSAVLNSAITGVVPNTSFVQPTGGAMTAPGATSRTNAAPRPGSFADKFGAAASQLVKAGMDPVSAMATAGLHALSMPNQPAQPEQPQQSDVPSGGADWNTVLAGKDQSQPTTPPPAQPSNAQRVINGVGANLGDLAAATEGGPQGGALAGAARVAAAASNRQHMEQENKIKIATANAQMLHEQALVHRLGQDEVDKSAAAGAQSLNEMMTAPNAEILASNKTSDDLQKMIQSKAIDPSRDAVFVTGSKVVGQDANGLPIMRTVYSVVKPGGRIAPSSAGIDFLNKYLPGSDFKKPDDDGLGGQTFDSHTYYWLNQRAMNNMAAVQSIQKIADENETRAHDIALKNGNDAFVANDAIRHAFSLVPQTGQFDPYLAVKAYGVLQREVATNPEILKTLPKNWAEQFAYTYGGGEPKKFEDQMNKFSQLQEKVQDAQGGVIGAYTNDPSKFEGKTAGILTAANAVLADRTGKYSDEQKLQAQAAKNMATDQAHQEALQEGAKTSERDKAKNDIEQTGSNGSTEIGDAFLNTLDASRRAVIMGYINGLSEWTPRLGGSKYGQSLLQDIRQYDPNWDAAKAPTYFKMRQDFTTGKTSVAINSANTAMHHITNMWDHLDAGATAGYTGNLEQFLGGNEQGRRLSADAKAVASELGRLYTGGVIGQHDQEEWAKKLDPSGFGMTANKLRTNIKEFVSLLGGKLQSIQKQWDDGVPSEAIQFKKGIISQDNLDKYQQITGDTLNVHDTQYEQKFGNTTPAAQQANRENATHGGATTPQMNRTNLPPANAGGVVYNIPDGKGGSTPMTFPNQAALDKFKLQYGLH